MQKLKLQNKYNKDTKSFDKGVFELRETDGTISGKVQISSKKGDKWLNKAMPFTAFKSKIDDETTNVLLNSNGESFEANINLVVDSFTEKETNKEIVFFKVIINEARGKTISQHSIDKGNAYVSEDDSDQIPW